MSAIPTGLSVLASILNAVFVLSGPAEIYFNGTMFSYVLFGCIIIFVPPTHLTLPVYRRINMISGHQVNKEKIVPEGLFPIESDDSLIFV